MTQVNILENNTAPALAAPAGAVTLPSIAERLASDAKRIEYATDVAGRKIGVRKLGFLEMFDLARILGSEDAANESAMNMATAAASVCSIDGETVVTQSKLELRALMTRLDFHGIGAALKALKGFEIPEADIASVKN